MRKFFCLIGVLALISCSEDNSKQSENEFVHSDFSGVQINVSETDDACKFNSELVCAINNYILCSINPERAYCLQNKKELPAFVFMKDESLKRPTSQTYEIVKMKPLADNQIEVYTQSVCDGNWFGLCQGNIIFVLQRVHDLWIVKDVYARESF